MSPVGAGFRWGCRETIISSISLFSHFYIISMKYIHLQALLRDWMWWMWFILCSPGCCVAASGFSLHAWGPDGICATHVPPNLSGTTLSRRTSFFQTTGKVLFMSVLCIHFSALICLAQMYDWEIDLCLALVCKKIALVIVYISIAIAAATTASKQAPHQLSYFLRHVGL